MSELHEYQRHSLKTIGRHVSFADKIVLEIGGDVHRAVALEMKHALGAKEVWSINTASEYTNTDAEDVHTRQLSAFDLSRYFETKKFDIVVSIAILEHIEEIGLLAREIRTVTAPGSLVYLQGGPFWTCCHGHHIVLWAGDRLYTFTGDNPVPDWLHLLCRDDEAADVLRRREIPSEHIPAIIEAIYKDPHVNRKKYSDIKTELYNSGLNCYLISEDIRRPPDSRTHEALVKAGWDSNECFGVYSAEFVFFPE